MLAGELGHDVVGVYPGPVVIIRLTNGDMLHVHAHDVVIATGASELHPVCEGNMLRGIYTAEGRRTARRCGCRPRSGRHGRARTTAAHRGHPRSGERGCRRRRQLDLVRLGGRHLEACSTARPVGTHGRRPSRANGRSRGSAVRAAAVPDCGHRLPVLEGHRRRSADGVGQGVPAHRAGQASLAVRHGHVPGQRVHATPAVVRRPPSPASRPRRSPAARHRAS